MKGDQPSLKPEAWADAQLEQEKQKRKPPSSLQRRAARSGAGAGGEAACVCSAAPQDGALRGCTQQQQLLKGDEVGFHSHVRTLEYQEKVKFLIWRGKKI